MHYTHTQKEPNADSKLPRKHIKEERKQMYKMLQDAEMKMEANNGNGNYFVNSMNLNCRHCAVCTNLWIKCKKRHVKRFSWLELFNDLSHVSSK